MLLISMDEYRLDATSDVGTFPILFEYKNRIEIGSGSVLLWSELRMVVHKGMNDEVRE